MFKIKKKIFFKILLLEAGGDESQISDVPALAAYLQLGRMDWKYKVLTIFNLYYKFKEKLYFFFLGGGGVIFVCTYNV